MLDIFILKFVATCTAATAAESITYPLDITKTRLQIQGENVSRNSIKKRHGMIKTVNLIVKNEGLLKLWSGYSPAVLRHIVYTGCRVPLYEYIRGNILLKDEDGRFPLWKAALCGASSGAVAALIASPTDLIKVLLQTEGKKSLEGKGLGIKNPLDAVKHIVRTGGVLSLWRGCIPTIQRAAIVTLGDFTTYDTVKHYLLKNTSLEDTTFTHALSSACSGLVSSILGTPVDVVKTRIMNHPVKADGSPLYRSSLDCLFKTVRKEGPFALYKGFVPIYSRFAPWSLIFWVTNEQVRKIMGVPSF